MYTTDKRNCGCFSSTKFNYCYRVKKSLSILKVYTLKLLEWRFYAIHRLSLKLKKSWKLVMITIMLQQERHSSWYTFCRCPSLLFHSMTKNRWQPICKACRSRGIFWRLKVRTRRINQKCFFQFKFKSPTDTRRIKVIGCNQYKKYFSRCFFPFWPVLSQ